MYQNILVINLAFIGDVILATPAVRALHERFPDARITMMTVPLTESVAGMNPYVDEVLVYDKKGREKGLFGMLRMAARLRKYRFDLAVCMNFAPRGAAAVWLARIPNRLGYDAQHGSFFLTMVASSKRPAIQHEAINHLGVLMPLDIAVRDVSLALSIPAEAQESCAAKLVQRGLPQDRFVVICPCGSYERKNLSSETVVDLVRALSKDCVIILIGGSSDHQRLHEAAHRAGLPDEAVLAGTLTLPELAALLQRAELLITVDTGPLHMAQAVKCPTVAVFGPTNPKVWGPRGGYDLVIAEALDADGNPPVSNCIESIAAEQILSSARWRLSQPR